jgi:DNA-binding PadR family transcriptional regulator
MSSSTPVGDEVGAPLSEATFFILLTLVPAPLHGYAIMKEVDHLSEGRVVLSTGTLYGSVKRLLEDGWIRRAREGTKRPAGGRVRKVYGLTATGRRVLRAESVRLQSLVKLARRRLVVEGA